MGGRKDGQEHALPSWGEAARLLAKRAWTVFSTFFVLGWIVRLIGFVLGADGDDLRRTLRDDLPGALLGWPLAAGFFGSLAVAALAGAVWLAGSAVAGYREPRAN